jgi:hypothetical protein
MFAMPDLRGAAALFGLMSRFQQPEAGVTDSLSLEPFGYKSKSTPLR